MKKIIKKILIGIGIFSGLIFLLMIGIFSYLGTNQAQNIIQARVNNTIPGNISWKSFDFSILAGRFELKDFLLKGPEDEKLAAIDRVFLNLSWTDLIKRNIHAENIVIDTPQLWLSRDNEGRLNLTKAFPESREEKTEPPGDTSMPFNIITGDIKITSGFFQYQEPGKKPGDKTGQVIIQDINLNSSKGNLLEKSGHLGLNIGKGSIDIAGIETNLDRFSLEAVLDKGRLEPASLSLDSDMADVNISGNVDQVLSSPDMDIDLQFETSLADIRKILNLEPELTGSIKIHLKGRGNPDNPDAELGFQYNGGILAGNQVDRINLECSMKDRLLSVKKLDINAPQGNVGLNGEINLQKAFAGGFLASPGDINAVSYNLELAQADTNLEKIPGQKDQLSGNINSNLKIQGTGISPANISAQAVFELFGEKIAFKDVLKPAGVHFLTRAGINKNQVTIEKLDLNAGTVNLGLKGQYNIDSREMLANIAFDLSDLGKPFSIPSIKNMSGKLNLDAEISGNLKQPLADLNLTGSGLGINDIVIGNLKLDAGLDKTGQVSVKSLDIDNQGSALQAKGVIQLLTQGLSLDPKLESDLSLAFNNIESKDFLAKEIFSGNLNGTLALKGPVKSPDAVLDLQGSDLGFEKNRIGNLDTALALSKGVLNLEKLNIQNQGSDVFISGTAKILDQDMKPLKNPEFNLKLDNTTLVMSDFSDSLTGELGVSADIQGSLAALDASIKLKGKEIASGERRIGNIEADLRFLKDTLFIEPVKIKNGKSGLDISGRARVLDSKLLKPLKDPEFDLELKGDGIFLEDFDENMKGRLILKGHVFGSAARPEGSITLNGKKIDLGIQKIEGIKLASNLDGEQVNIESFLLAMAPGEEIAADGWISPVKKIYDLRMKSKGISLKNIDSLNSQKLEGGKISLDLAGKGSFDNPQVNGDVNIKGLRLNDKLLQDLNIRLDVKDQVANISGNFNFDVNAMYHLKTKDFSAKINCRKTDLAPFFKIAGKQNLTGILTGIIEARGNADLPDRIKAGADIKHLSVFMDKKEMVKGENFKASLDNQEILVPGIKLSLFEQGNLNISGKGKLKGPLDFKVDGSIPMQVVSAFAQDIQDITGNLKISALLKGTRDKPDLKADLILDSIGMSIPGIEQGLNSLNGKINITPESINLKNVWGMLDKGRFDIDGKAVLKDFNPEHISAKLRAHALPAGIPDTAEMILSTELAFSGTPDKSSLTGEINILEGRYYKDVKISLLDKVGKKTRAESAPPSKQTSPFLKNLDLDVKVKTRQPFLVDNNMALMTLKPDLRIHGDLNNIKVQGRAEAEPGGIITYQKKDFEVQKGVVDFLNPYKIEPTLDIKSQTQIRTWTIFLAVSGTPDNLVLKLSSQPHEEDGDILSLLALGRTTRELVKGEGGTSTSTKQMLANIVAETLQESLKDATGLDMIEMKYTEGSSAQEDTDDIKVTVGKELSRRMTVKYGVETKDGVTVQQAITEYKFFENLLMKAFQDTEGDFGGELVFRLEFR
ncbi:Translocation and assembly module TamB domain-containing protein [Desulfonema limicola]|uniref:Translocation and assembly module TamB domain-containing protein n=1 Tax=Desulfonema limicola TaxID=45656 RepID=A0A975GIJ1_9BACT|nr:translocation/assembly module TamB domain-containing protein [Desulfonema limicola]QTA82665.1 Translocation and assembly module TamB domain-containing protein [Desulfonema limicola]